MGCLSSPGFRTILPHEALDSNDAWPDLERPVEKLIETARDLTGVQLSCRLQVNRMPSIRLISKLRSPDDACTSTFQDNPFAVIASTAGCRIFLSAVIA
jgi:hypothetical protein